MRVLELPELWCFCGALEVRMCVLELVLGLYNLLPECRCEALGPKHALVVCAHLVGSCLGGFEERVVLLFRGV